VGAAAFADTTTVWFGVLAGNVRADPHADQMALYQDIRSARFVFVASGLERRRQRPDWLKFVAGSSCVGPRFWMPSYKSLTPSADDTEHP